MSFEPEARALPREPRRLRLTLASFPQVAGVLATSIGAIVLFGWIASIRTLTYPVEGPMTMVANTSVMLLASGVALALVERARRARRARIVARIAAVVVLVVAIVSLLEYLLGIDLGIDQLVESRRIGPWPEGEPAPQTAVGFALVGFALLIIDLRTVSGRFVADYVAAVTCAISILAVLGHLFGTPMLYGETSTATHVGMSLITALVLVALSLGLLASHLEDGLVAIVVANDAGGVAARQLLAGLLLFPPVAIAVILGARRGLYPLSIASAMCVFVALAEATAFVLATARRLSRNEAAQRRVADELRASEARTRLLVEQASDGIFLADLDGRYIDVNPAGCAMLGYTRDELIGKTIADLLPPADLPKLVQERQAVLAGLTARGEWELRRRDASFISVEVVAKMLSDGRWQAIVRDITQRKRDARRLAAAYESEATRRVWLQSILDQLPEGVFVVDEHANVQAINRTIKAWVHDTSVHDSAAFANPAMFEASAASGALIPIETMPLSRVLRTGEPASSEEMMLRQPDGRMIPIEVRAGPIRDDAGRLIGGVAVVRDVSERKELERMREEWIAIVVHELRQPVAAIVSAVNLIHEGLASAHEEEILDGMREAAWRLNHMVGDLLDAARIAASRLSLDCRRIDIVGVVVGTIEQARIASPTVHVDLDAPEVELAWIDPGRIQQVLGNMLTNAIKYRTPGTTIEVQVRAAAGEVTICVVDQGATIEPAELAGLFQRFARSKAARESGKSGIGLGLYICKGLVEAHGGRIWAQSDAGTNRFCFTVRREQP